MFDTSVLLSSTLWDWSVSQKLLHKMIISDTAIFSSSEIIEEYQKVLHRDFEYSEDEINEIMTTMFSFINLINPQEKLDIVKDDPDDNKIITPEEMINILDSLHEGLI